MRKSGTKLLLSLLPADEVQNDVGDFFFTLVVGGYRKVVVAKVVAAHSGILLRVFFAIAVKFVYKGFGLVLREERLSFQAVFREKRG